MGSGRRFRFHQYWQNNLWMIPVIAAIVGGLLAFGLVALDKHVGTLKRLEYDEGTATAILSSLLGATVTFSGFIFTMLLLVPQFAVSQLSPRVLQHLYRDIKLKITFGMFVGTMMYLLVVLGHMRDGFVPSLSLWFAEALVVLSVLVFLAFVSHFIQNLRPATAATNVEKAGRRVLDRIYVRPYTDEDRSTIGRNDLFSSETMVEIRLQGPGGVILAIDERELIEFAKHADCVVVLTLAVGDYVSNDDVIFEVYGANAPLASDVLEQNIALGPERTFAQDPSFALRILVDIATQALSPAINNPTTASNVIDRIEDVLMVLIKRDLNVGRLYDAEGNLRVIVPMPTWDEYLAMAVTEIRQYGYNSIQVIRRLRRMLEDLLEVAPAAYRPSLSAELAVLSETAKRGFPEEPDLELAGIGPLRREIRRASSG
jgi:uncharacterized membrane protein